MAKKTPGSAPPDPLKPGEEWVSVTLEPKAGRRDKDVVAALRDSGACEIEILAPGFVSARAPSPCLDRLRDIAEVHLKSHKQMH